jgi:general secretion pathway protein F
VPRFRYRGVDRAGTIATGTLDAPDRAAAVARLQAAGTLPIRVEAGGGLIDLLNVEITPRDALGPRDRVLFTRALATLAGAGLPLDRTLALLGETAGRRSVRAVSGRLLEAVRSGASLSDALDAEASAFPPLYRAVVRAGEAGAALDVALARLADSLEDAARRRGALVSALVYPAFLLASAVGAVAILLGYVVPSFEPLLDEAGVEPPAVTRAVVALGALVRDWWAAIALGLALAFALARLGLVLSPAARLAWHRALLATPLLGGLWRRFETARLARLLGTLMQNGVALAPALALARGALSNRAFAAEMDRVIPQVEAGRGLAQPFAEGEVLPPLARQLLRVGEESGRLVEMLLKTADIYEDEAARALDRLLSLLTPLMTLLMGGVVAVIVSSILLALLSINELAL